MPTPLRYYHKWSKRSAHDLTRSARPLHWQTQRSASNKQQRDGRSGDRRWAGALHRKTERRRNRSGGAGSQATTALRNKEGGGCKVEENHHKRNADPQCNPEGFDKDPRSSGRADHWQGNDEDEQSKEAWVDVDFFLSDGWRGHIERYPTATIPLHRLFDALSNTMTAEDEERLLDERRAQRRALSKFKTAAEVQKESKGGAEGKPRQRATVAQVTSEGSAEERNGYNGKRQGPIDR